MTYPKRFFLVALISFLTPSTWLLAWNFLFDFSFSLLFFAILFSALSLWVAKRLLKQSRLVQLSARWFWAGCGTAFLLAVLLAARD